MSAGQMVVLIGIDGSGKSTVAEGVADVLQSVHGLRVEICWARWQPKCLNVVRAIIRFVLLRGDTHSQGKEEPRRISNFKATLFTRWRSLALLYLAAALLEYRLQYARSIAKARGRSDVLLLDRFWYDLVIDAVGGDENGCVQAAELVRWRWSGWFPRPTTVILLDVDEQTAFQRKGGENPLEYLARRRRIYQDVASAVGAVVLNSNVALADVVQTSVDAILTADGRTAGYRSKTESKAAARLVDKSA